MGRTPQRIAQAPEIGAKATYFREKSASGGWLVPVWAGQESHAWNRMPGIACLESLRCLKRLKCLESLKCLARLNSGPDRGP